MDVHWDDRPVDHDGLHDLETLLSADSESTSGMFQTLIILKMSHYETLCV